MSRSDEWFAWRPVKYQYGGWVWLVKVRRVFPAFDNGPSKAIYFPLNFEQPLDMHHHPLDMRSLVSKLIGGIYVLPSECHRYATCGDWVAGDNKLLVHVSRMDDWRSEWCVAIHEVVEALLCRQHGVSEQAVMDFDMLFEEERKNGLHGADDEPGDDPRAPYREEHRFATALEIMLADALGLSWVKHENSISSFSA